MKRITRRALLLTLALALCCATASAQEPLDITNAVTEKKPDGSISVYGIESEPLPITWGEFLPRFEKAVEFAGFEDFPDFAAPVYSDGQWVRMMMLGDFLFLRVTTTTSGDRGIVTSLRAVADAADDTLCAYAKQLTFCLYSAAARVEGTLGESMIHLLLYDPSIDLRACDIENRHWFQNGFDLRLGTHELYALGRVTYTGAVEQPERTEKRTDTAASFIWLRPLTEEAFMARFTPIIEEWFGMEIRHVEENTVEGYRNIAYSVDESSMLGLVMSDETEDASILYVVITDLAGNAPKAYAIGQIALYALTGISTDMLYEFNFINGEYDAWDDLVALNPCLRYGGVEMQCFDSNDYPAVTLGGAPVPTP